MHLPFQKHSVDRLPFTLGSSANHAILQQRLSFKANPIPPRPWTCDAGPDESAAFCWYLVDKYGGSCGECPNGGVSCGGGKDAPGC